MNLYLIAYDIADPKRLQRVARKLQKAAIRCQNSVFVLIGNREDLDKAISQLTPIVNDKKDKNRCDDVNRRKGEQVNDRAPLK